MRNFKRKWYWLIAFYIYIINLHFLPSLACLLFRQITLCILPAQQQYTTLYRLKLVEGKDCFILEACFADTVFNTMGQPFSKVNEVRNLRDFFLMILSDVLYRYSAPFQRITFFCQLCFTVFLFSWSSINILCDIHNLENEYLLSSGRLTIGSVVDLKKIATFNDLNNFAFKMHLIHYILFLFFLSSSCLFIPFLFIFHYYLSTPSYPFSLIFYSTSYPHLFFHILIR